MFPAQYTPSWRHPPCSESPFIDYKSLSATFYWELWCVKPYCAGTAPLLSVEVISLYDITLLQGLPECMSSYVSSGSCAIIRSVCCLPDLRLLSHGRHYCMRRNLDMSLKLQLCYCLLWKVTCFLTLSFGLGTAPSSAFRALGLNLWAKVSILLTLKTLSHAQDKSRPSVSEWINQWICNQRLGAPSNLSGSLSSSLHEDK